MAQQINRDSIRDLPEPEYLSLLEEEAFEIEGVPTRCFRLVVPNDDEKLDAWALHLRRHYIRDDELMQECAKTCLDPAQYLQEYSVPSKDTCLGSSCRSGDFGEIVISDILQFLEGYDVPRYKQWRRVDKDQSGPGTDVIAYRIDRTSKTPNPNDELHAIEVKTGATKQDLLALVRNAAATSKNEPNRLPITIAHMRRVSEDCDDLQTYEDAMRFACKTTKPYQTKFEVAAVDSTRELSAMPKNIEAGDVGITNQSGVYLVHRADLMSAIHELYSRCLR